MQNAFHPLCCIRDKRITRIVKIVSADEHGICRCVFAGCDSEDGSKACAKCRMVMQDLLDHNPHAEFADLALAFASLV